MRNLSLRGEEPGIKSPLLYQRFPGVTARICASDLAICPGDRSENRSVSPGERAPAEGRARCWVAGTPWEGVPHGPCDVHAPLGGLS